MKVFHCDHCNHLVFFENVRCVRCDHSLAYLPGLGVTGSLDPDGGGVWHSPLARANGKSFRLCRNYTDHNVCNWAIESADDNAYCLSCRLTRVIPNLGAPANKLAWFKLEVAKRRLIYTLLSLKLPVASKLEEPMTGLAFEFLADPMGAEAPTPTVLTGYANGVIAVNIAEADDAERERRRHQMHEPYRTLLGHFRHEVGHYYWDRLIKNSPNQELFRGVFGDEREDYAEALKRHYEQGATTDWQERFVSAYASAHPWEDWAETWAHYLHITDNLETAAECGLSLKPKRADEPALKPRQKPAFQEPQEPCSFDDMMDRWHALSYLLNNLNRGMGLPDGYPFVLSTPVIEKLRFVNGLVHPDSVSIARRALAAAAPTVSVS